MSEPKTLSVSKLSVSFPRMVITVGLVGHNSLMGALCERLIEDGFIQDVGSLNPEEIVFKIKKVQPEVNLYKELNDVRDILKIDEKKITLYIS